MGRPRGGTVSSSSDATSKVDSKSKAIVRTSTRERKELLPTYAEDSHSESEQEERDEDPGSDFKESMSESVSEPESSGSEYGVKKKKAARAKVSPKKSVGRGRGKKASPKRKAKASPAKPKGRPGRKPKSSPAKKTDRPQRSSNKRLKYKERSDSEEEDTPELTDESEIEEVMSESEEQYDSGSDSGRKGRKRKAPAEKPRGRAGPAKRAAAEKNGKKKMKDESEEEDEEEDMDEEPVKSKNDVGSKKSDGALASADTSSEEANGEGEHKDKKESKTEKPAGTDVKPKKADDEDIDDGLDDKESVKSKSDDGEKVLKNATETDYSTINFDCDKKTTKGDAPNLRISCWNVGGIKSWVKKNGLEYLKRENPDIICMQEIRSSEKTQPPEVSKIENYTHTYWSFAENAGHHGVGLLSKVKPENVTYGLPIKEDDSEEDKKSKKAFNTEGRLIVAEYDKFILINAYVPNGGRAVKEGNNTKPYPPKVTSGERGNWDRLFRTYVKELDAKKPVVLTGDLNVAHEEIDLANPKTNTSTAGFTKEERDGFTELLKETKLIDSFRSLYPDQKGAYSFWSYMNNSRQKNVGWRLDYFLISDKLQESLVESTMRPAVLGSDHCPIVLLLHI